MSTSPLLSGFKKLNGLAVLPDDQVFTHDELVSIQSSINGRLLEMREFVTSRDPLEKVNWPDLENVAREAQELDGLLTEVEEAIAKRFPLPRS